MRHYAGSADRDCQTAHTLKKIGGHGGQPGIEDFPDTASCQSASARLEGGGYESQCQRVVGDDFQIVCPVSPEKGRIEQIVSGYAPVPIRNQQQNQSAQHRSGNQGFLKHTECPFQSIGCQKTDQEHCHQVQSAPHTRVPETLHCCSLPSYSCIDNTYAYISWH